MDLPLTLQMEIDISAAWHKREIAEGFAKLRVNLLPEPEHDPWRACGLALQNALPDMMRIGQLQMMGGYWNPFVNAMVAAQGPCGMYTSLGQMGSRWF